MSDHSAGKYNCEDLQFLPADLKKLTINIERGKLSDWKNSCKNTFCVYDYNFFTHFYPSNSLFQATDNLFDQATINLKEFLEDGEVVGFDNLLALNFLDYFYLDFINLKSGTPGYRELFMADNIFNLFNNFGDVGLLVVGAAHLGFFEHFVSVTSIDNLSSIWEIHGQEKYRINP